MTSPALFVAAHPDDETLMSGVAIAEHVAAGLDVHILWLTRGTSSSVVNTLNGINTSTWWGVAHDPAAEGYSPLTAADLGAARIAEATTAVRCLATGLPGSLTLHEAGLQDGAVTQTAAADAIRAVCDLIAPGTAVRLKGHSQIVDNHPDHLAAGAAIEQLRAENPARFGDVRHYILPGYWTDSRLSQVTESWDLPTDAGISARARNACRAYGAWAPEQGRYAVGYHSVQGWLDTIAGSPKCMQHT